MNFLEEITFDKYPGMLSNSDYIFNGVTVPRVTSILSDMLHEDSLMSWSNFIGLVKRQKYKDVLEQAADKGTFVHNGIEDFINNGTELNINKVPSQYQDEVSNAYNSFLKWWEIVNKNNHVEVIMQEQPLVCQWYGGTLDILLSINGKMYLFDFKTSNHLSYKYIMQLAAYKYMLKLLYNIELDGVGIIKLDKQTINFEELIINLHQVDDANLMIHAENCFHSLVYAYYERKYIEIQFKERMMILNE